MVEETMPPIIGTAMRCMTSDPAHLHDKISNSPAMLATTVIIFGGMRFAAPSMIAWCSSALVNDFPSVARASAISRKVVSR
jgi:hypothetical protein